MIIGTVITVLFLLIKGSRNESINNTLPMWSKGLARTCCDIYPATITGMGFFEHGSIEDEAYYRKKALKNGDSVYVVTSDLPDFILSTFTKIDKASKIVLVSGCEDIGNPYEIFHPNRPNFFDYKMSALWPTGFKGMTMESFLEDNRLHTWFVQNYDAIGCNVYTCSRLSNVSLTNKIIPIPIGLDLHTFQLQKMPSKQFESLEQTVFDQMELIQILRAIMLPFIDRDSRSITVSFECSFDGSKIGVARAKSRGEVCNVIKSFKHTKSNIINGISFGKPEKRIKISNEKLHLSKEFLLSRLKDKKSPNYYEATISKIVQAHETQRSDLWSDKEIRRMSFWISLCFSRYSLAPPGFGMDTHRLWEILEFGAIPIVIRSPLDKLYSQFPIIILDDWNDLLQKDIFSKMDQNISSRFANGPDDVNVRAMLKLDFWKDKIRKAKESIPLR